ncbi:VanZ family protein [Sporosarcina sp. CAU 1771]
MHAPVLTIAWTVFIVIAAFTSNAHAFLYDQVVSFRFVQNPSLSDMFIIHDFSLSKFFLIQKIGHMVSFGVLWILVFQWVRKVKITVILCTLFALSTEVCQLFFGRNGRLYDVGIDFVGIVVAYGIWRYLFNFRYL